MASFQLTKNEVLILSQITGKTVTQIWLGEFELNHKQKLKLAKKQRQIKQNMPLDYILGQVVCGEIVLKVDKNVLIPRPETEFWLQKLIQKWQIRFANENQPKIVELGTGSGLIALTLAYKFPKIQILATDICPKALKIAKKNKNLNSKKINSKNVHFQKADLLKFDQKNLKNLQNNWILIANLPYVPSGDSTKARQNNVEFEPKKAIYSGESGLDHLDKLLEQLKKLIINPKYTTKAPKFTKNSKISKWQTAAKFFQKIDYFQIKNKNSFKKWSILPKNFLKNSKIPKSKITMPSEIYLELDPRNIKSAKKKLDEFCHNYLKLEEQKNHKSSNWQQKITKNESFGVKKKNQNNLKIPKTLEKIETKVKNKTRETQLSKPQKIWQSEIWLDENNLERLLCGEFVL